VRSDLFRRSLDDALITDFFGGVAQVEVDVDVGASAGLFRPSMQGPGAEASGNASEANGNLGWSSSPPIALGTVEHRGYGSMIAKWMTVLGLLVLAVGTVWKH
jgi:hypothetical protein